MGEGGRCSTSPAASLRRRSNTLPLRSVEFFAMPTRTPLVASLALFVLLAPFAQAQDNVIPHGQSKLPGPALSPEEAVAKMQLPPGFSVDIVAKEPDVINPTAFTFDDRGRIWMTES